MMTNTFSPHVGGVARSVERFSAELRRLGHDVLVVAPEYPGAPSSEEHVLRVPAIQRFNGTDFSVRIPIPGLLHDELRRFDPELVHSHHPFLLGDTAQRTAGAYGVPLVFTHHTMYERYTHYVPGDSPALKRYAAELATHYANLCDRVTAPSESIAAILKERGVQTPVHCVPTGLLPEQFTEGDGRLARNTYGIPPQAFVVGHVGRLAPEKNLALLTTAVALHLQRRPETFFLVVGSGPCADEMRGHFARLGLEDRLVMAGTLGGQELLDAYHAMDVFAFTSTSETQGMVLTEAMATGAPVVAVDAPGVREVVEDRVNGRRLDSQDPADFAAALADVEDQADRGRWREAAKNTARRFTMDKCAQRLVAVYEVALENVPHDNHPGRHERSHWEAALQLLEAERHLWENRTAAAAHSFRPHFALPGPVRKWFNARLGRLQE